MNEFKKQFMQEKDEWDKHVEEWSQASTAVYTHDEGKSEVKKKQAKTRKVEQPKKKSQKGPLQHDKKYKLTESRIIGGSFGPAPAKRLSGVKEDNREILYPNINTTHGWNKEFPKKPIKKTAKIPEKDKGKKLKTYVDTTNVDKAVRPNSNAVSFGKPPGEFESELEKVKDLFRKLKQDKHKLSGVSSYKVSHTQVEPSIHGVIMKKPAERSEALIMKDLEKNRIPGPGKYYADDRVLKEKQPEFTFKKEAKRNKTPPIDRRKQLIVNLDAVRRKPKVAKIMPEHAPKKDKTIETAKLGPGAYKLLHKHTEPRKDAGTVKWVPEEEKDAKIDERPELEPDFDHDKPNKGVPLYKEPTDVKPLWTPDKEKNPERWKFYDQNLDAIKEVQNAMNFAENLSRDDFISKDEYLKDLEKYKERHTKAPDIYSYDYKEKDTKIQFDFGKLEPRTKYEDKDLLEEFDKEGDMLNLEGDKPKKRIPGFNYDKMKGRFDSEGLLDDDQGDVLDLNPSNKLTKKRPISLVDIEKDRSREPQKYDEDDIPDNFLNYEKTIPDDPGEPAAQAHNFGKPTERFRKQGLIDDETKEELILDPEFPKRNVPTSNFGKAERRFKPPRVPIDPWEDEKPTTEVLMEQKDKKAIWSAITHKTSGHHRA
ncbi:unnamed protein product [Moneuplotes crassus]|uniref:Uncharacterized protein n=1 Tax=Euplotes crassus TaxID=5936 RepID=A0AAD1X6Y8_EUPCR|nr:unnamed protein product [Moneuplotes crassus]